MCGATAKDMWLNGVDVNVVAPSTDLKKMMLEKRKDTEKYTWFYDNVLSCVVGKNYWRGHARMAKATVMASVSDEALALVLLENMWDCMGERVNELREEVLQRGLGNRRNALRM